jgi:hypothetical protein
MKSQPVPKVSKSDVSRVVQRDYPAPLQDTVLAILGRYPAKSRAGTSRIQLAALKLAAGDVAALQTFIKDALQDFRDVVSAAEYPAHSGHPLGQPLTLTEKEDLFSADWAQYEKWLHARHSGRSDA